MDERSLRNLALLPPIRRARGWRLYAESGVRFLDLWQDEGRGVLGAKGTGVGTVAKALVDRGLGGPLPSVLDRRLAKALSLEWPRWKAFRAYADESEARAALAAGGYGAVHDPERAAMEAFRDAAVPGKAGLPREAGAAAAPGRGDIILIRSFDGFVGRAAGTGARAEDGFRAALLRLPCPRAFSPAVCLFRDEEDAPRGPGLPPPAFLLASAAKALAEMEGLRRIANEETWRRADRRIGRLFERQGPWLFARVPDSDYDRLFKAALDRGLLLSPDPGMPSILPPEFDDGELKPLSDLAI